MSEQRCSKCRGRGHNRLSCGKSKQRNPRVVSPSRKDATGSRVATPVSVSKGESVSDGSPYGALHAAFQTKKNVTQHKDASANPAATVIHTPIEDRDAIFTVYAEVDGQRVGRAEFRPTLHGNDAMITTIWVDEAFRRRGIAQQMWEKAKELGFEPVHSPRREPDGEAFAAAVGGPTPPNMALSTRDMPEGEREALRKALWDWYASRPAKRSPKLPQ